MGLESGTYISSLNASNPVGASDPKSQGDDHIRLLKSTILATFANITGAVTASHTQLNRLASLSAVSVLGRSANTDGEPAAIAAAANDRILRRVGDALDFGQLTAGMVPNDLVTDAMLRNSAAVSVIGRAANSTGDPADIAAGANDRILRRTGDALNFGQLTAGMFPNTVVPDAALSANVTLLNGDNVIFTGAGVTLARTAPLLYFHETDAVTDGGLWRAVVSGNFHLQVRSDDDSSGENALIITRTGVNVDQVQLLGDSIIANGGAILRHASGITAGGEITIASDPGGTPSGDPGDMFLYY